MTEAPSEDAQAPPGSITGLANAYADRAFLHSVAGEHAAAASDSGLAFRLLQSVCGPVGPAIALRPEIQFTMCHVQLSRATAQVLASNSYAGFTDAGEAIDRLEALRHLLEPLARWTPRDSHILASAYSVRANAATVSGRVNDALADLEREIQLDEELRAALGPRSQWPIEWRMHLAGGYSQSSPTETPYRRWCRMQA